MKEKKNRQKFEHNPPRPTHSAMIAHRLLKELLSVCLAQPESVTEWLTLLSYR